DGKTALAVIVRQHRRELLKHNVRWEFVPAIVVPGLGIERVITAGTDGIVPFPATELSAVWVSGGEHLRNRFPSLRFLIHGELVRPDRLIFVHAALDMPAREVSAIGARESAGAKSANGRTLPVAVVNHSLGGEFRFAPTGMIEGLADATMPSGSGDCI